MHREVRLVRVAEAVKVRRRQRRLARQRPRPCACCPPRQHLCRARPPRRGGHERARRRGVVRVYSPQAGIAVATGGCEVAQELRAQRGGRCAGVQHSTSAVAPAARVGVLGRLIRVNRT